MNSDSEKTGAKLELSPETQSALCNVQVVLVKRDGYKSLYPGSLIRIPVGCNDATITWTLDGDSVEFRLPNDFLLLDFANDGFKPKDEDVLDSSNKTLTAKVHTTRAGAASVVFWGSTTVNSVVIVE